uniref:type I protein arginine methyltransferase n=1 Tax=Glossina brevipalpis TaxID=37001 RepID=A0A1A9WPT9_9MUSC
MEKFEMNQKKLKKKKKKKKKNVPDHNGNEGIFKTPLSSSIEKMTSCDFQTDDRAHVEIMDQSVKDVVRILAFKNAIMYNKHLFRGRVVLNLNCGVGIFALFAAKAGSAKVFAVDNSNVVHYTKQIVQNNDYHNVIQVIKGKITEIELPVKKVDIIVSDWMGYALLYKSTCSDVLYARDKWLKSDGLIFPDKARLFVAAIEDEKHKNGNIEWWRDVYGFNMNCLREVAVKEPRYQSVKVQQILSKQFPMQMLDLNKATCEDLHIRSKFMLPIQRSGRMDGIALYFHVYFSKSHVPLALGTDPWSPITNWLQTVFFLDESITVNVNSMYYGGIELCSPGLSYDCTNILVNFEMLKGEPAQAEMEAKMCWHMKSSYVPQDILLKAAGHSSNEPKNSQRDKPGITKISTQSPFCIEADVKRNKNNFQKQANGKLTS